MSYEREKKGILGRLFRSKSIVRKPSKLEKEPRRASDGDVLASRRRKTPSPPEIPVSRRRPRRPEPEAPKGKDRDELNGHRYDGSPLTEWPPSGMNSAEELNLGHAMQLISKGVPAFKGHKRMVPHASEDHFALYATTAGNSDEETDGANLHDTMTKLMTLRMLAPGLAAKPWDTFEQPSNAFSYGKLPGTVTLNYWVSISSVIPPTITLRDSGYQPREVDLTQIFARLRELEGGLEDDDEDLMYKNLYRRFLRDPDKILNPHRSLHKQMIDLVRALSAPDWLDFTNPRNQVVTKFIFDTGFTNHQQYLKFFHQLLLSLELDLRINSRFHDEQPREQLMSSLPPAIKWNLALARRWRENVRVEGFGKTADQVKLRFKLRRKQVKMLKRFAQMMKWPNLEETLVNLRQGDAESSLHQISSHTMAYFSGLVLPGVAFPFLIMNSLIDVDPDRATDSLALLTHIHPNCGFQYRNSYTYWTSTSVVGKVLAPTCHDVAGWVGPARPTVDLGRSQIARIRSRRPRQRVGPEDVRTMSERSDPLGPPSEVFPVREYKLVLPDNDDAVDIVRTEMLSLKPVREAEPDPRTFDAAVLFAIDGVSWRLKLTYDVCFVCAWPCSEGPHPLFFDYPHQVVRADEVVRVADWGGLYGNGNGNGNGNGSGNGSGPSPTQSRQNSVSSSSPGPAATGKAPPQNEDDVEKVLVVEAFGVADNEVLARAWCAHWGLSAIVADIGKTCMACAIREAYAATITVVILVEKRPEEDER